MDEAIDSEGRLRRLAALLEPLQSQRELIEMVSAELVNTLGYRTTWLGVYDASNDEYRVLAAELGGGEDLWDSAVPIPVAGDHYVRQLLETTEPQVVVDAQIDEHVNREVVQQLGNRTVINVPIFIDGEIFGSIGTGTFGEEGPRPPSDEDVEYLTELGQVAGNALSRILRLAGHIA